MSYLSDCVIRCGTSAFAVDSWRTPGLGAYFLTHAHADHTAGLSDAWCMGPLYCSPDTRALLLLKFPALSRLAVPLPLDECAAVHLRPRAAPSGDEAAASGAAGEQLCVTPLDAGHCPGSAAFLFEGACGRVLHTGDWRRGDPLPVATAGASDDDAPAVAPPEPSATSAGGGGGLQLPAALLRAPLDCVYLDNTYCHPSYDHPPRAAAAAALAALLASPALAGRRILLGIDTLGKEELLGIAARAVGGLVAVSAARLAAARALGAREGHLSLERAGSAVWTAPRWQLTQRRLAAMNPGGEFACDDGLRTVGVLPTGWPGGAPGSGSGSAATSAEAQLVHCVPYSLHAPFRELAALMAALRPHAVRGLVASPADASRPTDPRLHFAHLLTPLPRPARPLPAAASAEEGEADAAARRPPLRQRPASQPRVCGAGAVPGDAAAEAAQCAAAAFAAAAAASRRRAPGLRLAFAAPQLPQQQALKQEHVKGEEAAAAAVAAAEEACARSPPPQRRKLEAHA